MSGENLAAPATTTRPPAREEAAALEAIHAGDREKALGLLMQAYGRGVYGYCRQMLRETALAEDVLQTTFLQAHRDLPRFAGRSTLRSWLFGIAAHRCLDALKQRRRREKRLVPIDALERPPETDARLDERLEARLRSDALWRCLGHLEPHVRAALLLRFVEGLSYPEMAEVELEQPATLQARVARALPALRRCVEEGRAVA